MTKKKKLSPYFQVWLDPGTQTIFQGLGRQHISKALAMREWALNSVSRVYMQSQPWQHMGGAETEGFPVLS